VSLTVEATGVGLRYQWRKGGTNIPGATQAAYEIANVTTSTSGSYDCVVTGSCTPNATSKPATVSVAAQTAVTSHPKDVTVKTNQSFSLTVVASGSTLTYKWMRNGTEIAGANAATYTVNMASAADAGTYKCEVTGGCGTATSNEAVVTFDPTSVQEDVVAGGNTLRVLGPIPATDLLSIRLTMQMASTDAVLIRCVSADGSVVMVHNAGSMGGGENTITFPVASLASGVYGLEVAVGANVLRTAIQIAR
jgi:predicted hotdog family 3-hydroxylacyl-ACP dehydratase